MTTRRSKSYFFTGAYGPTNKKFKKGNQPDENTYREWGDSVPFINDAADTAKTTEQGLVKKSTSLQYLAGTDNDPGGMALYPLPSLIQTQFATYRTSALQDVIDATHGTVNVEHSAGVGSGSRVIKTYHLNTTNGVWTVNTGGGAVWGAVFDPGAVYGITTVLSGSGVPTSATDISTYYCDTATGDWYVNAGGGTTWTVVYQPVRFVYASVVGPSPAAPTYLTLTTNGKIYYSAGGVGYSLVYDPSVIYGVTDVISGSGAPSGSKTVKTYYIDTATGNTYLNVGGGSTWASVFFPGTVYGTTDVIHGIGAPSGAKTIKTYYFNTVTGDWYVNAGGGSTWSLTLDVSTMFGMTNWESGSGLPPATAHTVPTYYIDTATGNIYYNDGTGGSSWSSVFYPTNVFYTETEVDAKINVLHTELTDTFLLSATGTEFVIPFPTLSANQAVEIISVITHIVNKYTDGAASTNTVTMHFDGSAPDVFCTIENTAFMNNNRAEVATIDRSTEAKRMLYLGPTNGAIVAIQTGTNHMTGSTDHMKVKISYRIHDFA